VTTSKGWRLREAKPKPDEAADGADGGQKARRPGPRPERFRLSCRDLPTVLGVAARHGLPAPKTVENVGNTAWEAGGAWPADYTTDDITDFIDGMVAAHDPMPGPATPDDDGMSAEEVWGSTWSPPPRTGTDRQAAAAVVCGIELTAGEVEEFERAKAAGALEVGPWVPLGSRVEEAWRRWCDEQGLPANVREVQTGTASCRIAW
jgi:hypothetical protein